MLTNQTDVSTAPELKSKIGALVNVGGGTMGGIALKETFATLFNSQGIFSKNLLGISQIICGSLLAR